MQAALLAPCNHAIVLPAGVPPLRLFVWVRKDYPWDFVVPSKTAIIKSIKEREKTQETGRLACKDISDGDERVRHGLRAEDCNIRRTFMACDHA